MGSDEPGQAQAEDPARERFLAAVRAAAGEFLDEAAGGGHDPADLSLEDFGLFLKYGEWGVQAG